MNLLLFEHIDSILNFVLFTSTSTLTLIGLISLFTSFNIQNKIQRLTDILSDIESLNELKDFDEIESKFANLMAKYERVFVLKQDIEEKIINKIKKSIILICGVWSTCILILIPKYYFIEWIYLALAILIVMYVLSIIIKLIEDLLDLKAISYLPTVNELLDVNRTGNSFMLLLIAKTAVISLASQGDEIEIRIGLPIKVDNFSISTEIYTYDISFNESGDTEDYIRLDSGENYENYHSIDLSNGSLDYSHQQVWYTLIRIKTAEIKKNISIQIDMSSRIAYTTSHYYTRKSEIEEGILLIPYEVKENINYENSTIIPRSDQRSNE